MRCSKPGWSCVDHLDESAVRRTFVVDFQSLVSTLTFGTIFFSARKPIAQHAIQIRIVEQDVADACLETLPFGQIELKRAETIREKESVHDIPALFENADAFTIFIPQAASAPAILANKNGRSKVDQR